jgi:hypothetical protein
MVGTYEEPNGRFSDVYRRLAALESRMNEIGGEIGQIKGRFDVFAVEQAQRHTENRDAIREQARETASNRRFIIGAIVIPSLLSLVSLVAHFLK